MVFPQPCVLPWYSNFYLGKSVRTLCTVLFDWLSFPFPIALWFSKSRFPCWFSLPLCSFSLFCACFFSFDLGLISILHSFVWLILWGILLLRYLSGVWATSVSDSDCWGIVIVWRSYLSLRFRGSCAFVLQFVHLFVMLSFPVLFAFHFSAWPVPKSSVSRWTTVVTVTLSHASRRNRSKIK